MTLPAPDATGVGPDRFSAPYRVRFDEAGPDGLIRTSSILRYTQDLAGRHSEARGYDRAWYAERGLTWLVRTAVVAIEAPIVYGADLGATTSVVAYRRVWARRRSEFRVGDGRGVATVDIDWVLIDRRGAPTRIPVEFDAVSQAPPSGEQVRRVDPGPVGPGAHERRIDVRPHELDPLGHPNNAVYADWLDEAVFAANPDDAASVVRRVPRRVAIEYAAAPAPDSAIVSSVWRADPGGWRLRLRSSDGRELARARLDAPGETPDHESSGDWDQ